MLSIMISLESIQAISAIFKLKMAKTPRRKAFRVQALEAAPWRRSDISLV